MLLRAAAVVAAAVSGIHDVAALKMYTCMLELKASLTCAAAIAAPASGVHDVVAQVLHTHAGAAQAAGPRGPGHGQGRGQRAQHHV